MRLNARQWLCVLAALALSAAAGWFVPQLAGAAPATGTLHVTVIVDGVGDAPITLVMRDMVRLREYHAALAPDGGAVTWDVPAGAYQVHCYAGPGWLSSTAVVWVQPGGTTNVMVTVRRLWRVALPVVMGD